MTDQSQPSTPIHPPIIQTIPLTEEETAALPPEVRDQLLDYLALWGQPQEVLDLIQLYRRLHGPLLHFLDRESEAYMAQGEFEQAIETIERRQRRSTTLESQTQEIRALLQAGHVDAAKAVVEDLASAYPNRSTAVMACAEALAGLGQYERGKGLVQAFLQARPGHLQAVLCLAHLALANQDESLAQQMAQQLGVGISAQLGVPGLHRLEHLYQAMGNDQSAQAARLEIERQHTLQQEALRKALEPLVGLVESGGLVASAYGSLSSPDRITINRKEEREVKLAAIRNFGFMELRPGQTEIIASVIRGESALAVMPTGAGKSLCYQLPALMLPKATLIISPLIALMKDQVESLPAAAQAKATFINSTLSDEEMQERLDGVAAGHYKLIYAAPERLRQRPFLWALRDAGLSLFVVDEAHCVSLWGHDFRPDYLFIQEARSELANPTALAMTATAPPRVRDEILDNLTDNQPTTERPQVISLDIFRSNLHLSGLRFHSDEEKLAALVKFVKETGGSGIVYANSRRKCEALALQLRGEGVNAEAYHAGLLDRGGVQDRFMSDRTRVVVATVAFGMGIDKSDIRFIVHFHPPRSLAAYYQEAGRAGRDGKPAQCVLYYSSNDWSNLRRWAKSDEHDIDFLEKTYAAVATQLGVSLNEAEGKKAVGTAAGPVNLRRLEQVLNASETDVRVAVSLLERADLLTRSFDLPKEIEITLSKQSQTVTQATRQDHEFARLLRRLALRPGQQASFESRQLAEGMKWPLLEVEQRLLAWHSAGLLTVRGSRREMSITLPPRPADLRERLAGMITHARALGQRRIDDMVAYATAESCRHGFISAHFGSPPRTRCDVCDNCTGIRPEIPQFKQPSAPLPDDVDIEPMILDCLISSPKPVGRSGLARILTGSLRSPVAANECRHHGRLYSLGEGVIIESVDELLAQKLLRQYERNGYPVLAPTLKGRTLAEEWLAEHPELAAPTGQPPQEPDEPEDVQPAERDKYTALQRALYLWRRRTADEQGIPTYVIMGNDLLFRIAESHPTNMTELAALPGMGEQRLDRYGGVILDLVNLHQPEEGDETLLATQRAQQQSQAESGQKTVATSAAQPAPMDPRTERRIFMKLQELRQRVAVRERSKPYLIANNNLLKAIASQGPQEPDTLMAILGFRSSGLRDEADAILTIIRAAQDEG
jgi:ATP-dependent DNA helicase RecQ